MIEALKLLADFVRALFRSNTELEAENAALRHQLTVLQRKLPSRARVTSLMPQPPAVVLEDEGVFKLGDESFAGYAFDDPWEVVHGTWIVQVWEGDHKFVEKAFAVVAR